MLAVDEQADLEKTKAEALIAEGPRFPGIDFVRIDLDEDNTGDPSMWIVFRIRREATVDDSWVKAYAEYTTNLTRKLIQSGLTRFPYTRLESEG